MLVSWLIDNTLTCNGQRPVPSLVPSVSACSEQTSETPPCYRGYLYVSTIIIMIIVTMQINCVYRLCIVNTSLLRRELFNSTGTKQFFMYVL